MSFNEWTITQLGSLIRHKKGFAFKSKDLIENGHPIIKVTNFTDNSIDINGCFHISNEDAKKFSDYAVKRDDIIIATVGSWPNNPNSIVGKVIKVPVNVEGALLNQNAVILRSKNETLQLFLYYRLKSKDFSSHLLAGARGSANQASISLEDIFKFNFELPSIYEQNYITSILSSIDNKIELNRQTNQTLEVMAQTLFREWFEKFNYPGFTGIMAESDLGLIPEGWFVGNLGSICSNVRKSSSPKDWELDIPYIGLEHIQRKNLSISQWGKSSDVNSQKFIFKKGEILFGKLRPYFHKVGIAPVNGICSTDILVIRAIEDGYQSYVISHLYDKKLIDFVSAVANGTRMPRVDWKSISNYPIVIPTKDLIIKFNNATERLYEKMLVNILENQTLTTVRDSLLPKLMKGEINLNN